MLPNLFQLNQQGKAPGKSFNGGRHGYRGWEREGFLETDSDLASWLLRRTQKNVVTLPSVPSVDAVHSAVKVPVPAFFAISALFRG